MDCCMEKNSLMAVNENKLITVKLRGYCLNIGFLLHSYFIIYETLSFDVLFCLLELILILILYGLNVNNGIGFLALFGKRFMIL